MKPGRCNRLGDNITTTMLTKGKVVPFQSSTYNLSQYLPAVGYLGSLWATTTNPPLQSLVSIVCYSFTWSVKDDVLDYAHNHKYDHRDTFCHCKHITILGCKAEIHIK